MDTNVGRRFHGPHLPTAVRQGLPQTLHEIEAATNRFLAAAAQLTQQPNRENAERVWMTSRWAWSLLLPRRDEFLETHRALVRRFQECVQQLRQFLREQVGAEDDLFQQLMNDLARREALLDALLAENSEPRIRQLLGVDEPAPQPH